MTIKEIVFEYIQLNKGHVNYVDLTDKVLQLKPTSKWDKTHWNWYKNQITSSNGKFFKLFTDEERQNLRATIELNNVPSSKEVKKKQKVTCHFYEDKSQEVEHELADILARVAHHIHPKIVKKIVAANKNYKERFASICHKSVDVDTFLYDGSDCVFPGARRCINDEKVGKWKNKVNAIDGTILNDNTYPRNLWAFLCAGRAYAGGKDGFWTSSGLNAFELAHVFAHKIDERTLEPKVFFDVNNNIKPFSLFTSASNTVLLPKGLTKPTDKNPVTKIVFYKRHLELYGEVATLPGLSLFDESQVPDWYRSLKWIDPVLPDDWEAKIDLLLQYREQYINNLYSSQSEGSITL